MVKNRELFPSALFLKSKNSKQLCFHHSQHKQTSSSQMFFFRRNVEDTKSYEAKGKKSSEKNFSTSIGACIEY